MLIDWVTVGAQAINFLVLVWLLNRFLFKPILKVVKERDQKIRNEVQEASRNRAESQKEKEALAQEREELVKNRESYFAQARADAQMEKDALLQEAHTAHESLRQTLQGRLQHEQAGVFLEMKQKLEEEIFQTVRKILADITNASLEDSVADIFIHKLEELSEKEKEDILIDIQTISHSVYIRSAFEHSASRRLALEQAIRTHFGKEFPIIFEINPELVCGVELVTSGHKVSWSISEYLSSMRQLT
jgi:F-type H+-transporting ATPase subunit b